MEIAFNVNGLYIVLHGPFPQAVIDAVNKMLQFQERKFLINWLNMEWPGWRQNIVRSENLW
jgi:hypothetical protein